MTQETRQMLDNWKERLLERRAFVDKDYIDIEENSNLREKLHENRINN